MSILSENIDSIGLEFECYLSDPYKFKKELERAPYNYELIGDTFNAEKQRFKAETIAVGTDGSVQGEFCFNHNDNRNRNHTSMEDDDEYIDWFQIDRSVNSLEIRSKWKYNDNVINDINDYAQFLFRYFKQNYTCGNHIHLSFNNNTRIASVAFTYKNIWHRFISDYKNYFAGKEKYINRFKNKYCRSRYNLNNITRIITSNYSSGDRYYAINLMAFRRHKTVEFRIMPYAENADEYVSQIRWLLKEIETIFTKNHSSVSSVPFLNERIRHDRYMFI